ncbi:MAG TPA: hypothetical protein VF747_02750 [Blastocatellia bacterium]|jgi:hypothetical protein
MALLAAFQDLCLQLQKLHDSLFGLRVTIVEDKPLKGDVMLVDKYCDAAEDMVGWWEEAGESASAALQAVTHPADFGSARRALINCHDAYTRISQRFTSELTDYERMAELTSFARSRRGEWEAWVNSVKEALDRCQQPLFDVYQSISLCWQEMTDRNAMTSVSVQMTNTGQKIIAKELAHEGVT